MLGTIINAGTVILGSCVGLLVHSRLPQRITTIVFQCIGLFTLFLGITMAMKTGNFLIMIFSIVLGAVAGELLDIDARMNRLSELFKRKIRLSSERFSEGLVTSFLVFCMGSMSILGPIEEGLGGPPNLLLAKSVLDAFSSMALAASLGVGVLFSVIPLVLYQGGITLFAGSLQGFFTTPLINELTAVGGILLMGLGINLLEIKSFKILNMLPSLVIVVILASIFLR
ncbi:MAG: ydfK [Deltaproteobacteria bacterium]|nr:ydfK [Deltaproteobacteria bacterium]